jgi:RHS repeat-associated protein
VDNGRAWSGTHNYSRGPGGVLHDSNGTGIVFTPGLAERKGGTTDRFYHSDWLGSTRYLSDSTGNNFPNGLRYDGYGRKASQTGGDWHPSQFLFAGGWGYQTEYTDEWQATVGLQYLEQRYYDPEIGRFVTADPIKFAGGLNLYSYCSGDPVNSVDPSGLVGVQFGNVKLAWGDPDLIFTAGGVGMGVATGTAAVGNALSFGLYDGGGYRSQPGFGASSMIAGVGREALIAAGTAGAGSAYGAYRAGQVAASARAAQGSIALYKAAKVKSLLRNAEVIQSQQKLGAAGEAIIRNFVGGGCSRHLGYPAAASDSWTWCSRGMGTSLRWDASSSTNVSVRRYRKTSTYLEGGR